MASFSYIPTDNHLKCFGRYVCKDCRWISNNRGEEFQRVGKKIFIKSKMFLFLYTLIISIRIFKILTFLPSYNPFKA